MADGATENEGQRSPKWSFYNAEKFSFRLKDEQRVVDQ